MPCQMPAALHDMLVLPLHGPGSWGDPTGAPACPRNRHRARSASESARGRLAKRLAFPAKLTPAGRVPDKGRELVESSIKALQSSCCSWVHQHSRSTFPI